MQSDKKFWVRSRKTSVMMFVDCSVACDSESELDLVFFDPELLTRYQFIPCKYIVGEGSIESKDGQLMLKSCYEASNGDIYCYRYDLLHLPEKEFLYFKLFNLNSSDGEENPIARNRDLYCSFDDFEKEGLSWRLKNFQKLLEELRKDKKITGIWRPKEGGLEEMINEIVLPRVQEYKQYRDGFLLPLARLVIEGFVSKELREWASMVEVSTTTEDGRELGTLAILKKCLVTLCGESEAAGVVKPLEKLQREKSARSSHGGKEPEAAVIEKSKDILKEVTKSIVDITKIMRGLK